MTLVFDLETTGKLTNDPLGHRKQPYIVQFGALLLENNGDIVSEINLIVKPNKIIPNTASIIHGITNKKSDKYGVPVLLVMSIFKYLIDLSDTVVGFNIDYDLSVMKHEFFRANKNFPEIPNVVDVMKIMIPICKIPGYYHKYKFPSLKEAHQFVFETTYTSHSAIEDTKATARLYQWLKNKNYL